MSLIELSRRMLAKGLAKHQATQAPRQDNGLPYGAKIGSLIEVPRASFALLDGSLMKVPAAAQMQIESVGRVRLAADPSIELYRLYTSKGDARTDAGQSFLQVLMDNGQPVEATYYQQLFRTLPTSVEEQEAYLGKGFGLGELYYTMAADQLAMCGLSDTQIAAMLGETEAIEFLRDTPTTVQVDYVPPYVAIENRLDDAAGDNGLRQRMHFMPYTRELPCGGRENLLISFEVVESVNGLRAPAVHVDYLAGLTLEPQKIKVL